MLSCSQNNLYVFSQNDNETLKYLGQIEYMYLPSNL